MSFIKENVMRQQLNKTFTYADTLGIARVLFPNQAKHTLDAVCKTMGISLENHHRAVDDAGATAEIFVKMIPLLKEQGVTNLKQVNEWGASSKEIVKRLPSYHAIILAENNVGRENLYRLVSASHLDYYSKRPRVPKSFLMKHREGLILGSACEAGELYRALLEDKSEAEIARLVNFYDYLEIQPLGNNEFMIESERVPSINSMEDIRNINRRIVELGEEYGKPVVATCDVHFLDPEDEVYRRISWQVRALRMQTIRPLFICGQQRRCLQSLSILAVTRQKRLLLPIRIKLRTGSMSWHRFGRINVRRLFRTVIRH